MSDAFKFKIELTPEAQRIVANLQKLPPQILAAIARGMDRANQDALAKIKPRLIGQGPFPPEQHKLGRRSGSLFSGVYAAPSVVEGETVKSAIGTPTTNKGFSYPALHEFGGRVHRKGREHRVRLATDSNGNLLRQLSNSKLAIFAGRKTKHSVERTGKSQDHEFDMPARAPFRTGIAEAKGSYTRHISAGIVAAWNNLSK